MSSITETILAQAHILQPAIVVILLLLLLLIVRRFVIERVLPRAHDIAVIGFAKSGKTTLITMMFEEALSGEMDLLKVYPSSKNTVERQSQDLARLKSGEALEPSKIKDIFPYRANMSIKRFGALLYKVRIADFPGDLSEDMSRDGEIWHQNSSYFRWFTEGSAFLFVIDLAQYLDDRDAHSQTYVIHMSDAIRTAWQTLLHHNPYWEKQLRRCPLVLAFTKADLFKITTHPTSDPEAIAAMQEKGLGDLFPHNERIEPTALADGIKNAQADFSELIAYMKAENETTQVIFVSAAGVVNGKKIGIDRLFYALLPFKNEPIVEYVQKNIQAVVAPSS